MARCESSLEKRLCQRTGPCVGGLLRYPLSYALSEPLTLHVLGPDSAEYSGRSHWQVIPERQNRRAGCVSAPLLLARRYIIRNVRPGYCQPRSAAFTSPCVLQVEKTLVALREFEKSDRSTPFGLGRGARLERGTGIRIRPSRVKVQAEQTQR